MKAAEYAPVPLIPAALRHAAKDPAEHPISIAILDDHPVISASMQCLLGAHRDLHVTYSDTAACSMLDFLCTHPCDALILDYYLPESRWDGVELVRRVRRAHPELAIIVFTAGRVDETRHAVFRAGANGFMSKSTPFALMPQLLRLTAQAPGTFFHCIDDDVLAGSPPQLELQLTAGEIEILRQIALGQTVGQVAARMLRSKKTISTHKRRAMHKLGLADDMSLALYLRESHFGCRGDRPASVSARQRARSAAAKGLANR